MGIKISEMTADASIGGSEMIPVSDAGTAKRVTVDQIKQHTIDAIEATAAASSVTGADGVFILQGGVLKPVDIDVVAQHVIDTVWGKAAESSPADAHVVPLKNGSTEKTLTLTALAEYVRAEIQAAILDVTDLGAAGALGTDDLYLVTQSGVGKKVTFSTFRTAIYSALATHVAGLSAVTTPADADTLYIVQGGTGKKVTVAQLRSTMGGDTIAPAITTEDKVPQWDSTAKTLKDGLTLRTVVRASGTAADTSLPTEKAVRDLFGSGLIDGQTEIGGALDDADEILVRDGTLGAQSKSLLSRVWTYIWSKVYGATAKTTPVDADTVTIADSAASSAAKTLTFANLWAWVWSKVSGAASKATPVDADSVGIVDSAAANVVKNLTLANLWTNLFDAKAKTVKLDDFATPDDNTDLDATTVQHGLLPKLAGGTVKYLRADGTWVEPGVAVGWDGDIADVDLDGGTDIGADLADADLILVDDGAGGTNRKSALSRFWTYIWGKVSATSKATGVDGDSVILKDSEDSGSAKTLTLTALWTYVQSKIQACAGKTTGVDADITMIQDSAASFALKEFTLANLFAYVQSKLVALTAKGSPVAADSIVIKDSAAPTTCKLSTFTQVWNSVYLALTKLVRLDEMAAAIDNTTNDASASAHGLMPKADKIRFDALTYSQTELAADPADPAEGKHIIWQSDGTGYGDDGDICIKITAGGVTKTGTLVDFSAL